jgi:hypothetical protein
MSFPSALSGQLSAGPYLPVLYAYLKANRGNGVKT